MLYRPSEDKNINRLWVLTTKTLAFSLATLITFLNLPLRLPPKDQRSQKVHWGICLSALFHYVPSKRSCLHQMLRCVACLLLPGTVITREPLLKKSRGKEKSDPSTMTGLLHILPLSFITYQLIGRHSIPTLRGRSLDQCCQSGGPSETSHWLLPQRLRRPGVTGSPARSSSPGWGRICGPRASLTVARPRRTSFPVAESFIGLSSFSLAALRVHEC